MVVLERILTGAVIGEPPIDIRAIPEKLFVIGDEYAAFNYGETCKLLINVKFY
jgi:hypothetical protein